MAFMLSTLPSAAQDCHCDSAPTCLSLQHRHAHTLSALIPSVHTSPHILILTLAHLHPTLPGLSASLSPFISHLSLHSLNSV